METDERFSSNCERWAQLYPEQAEAICKHVPMAREAPVVEDLEAQKEWFGTLDLHQINVLFVYGAGAGELYDVAQKWLQEDPERALILFEDDKERLFHLLHTERASLMLQDRQVRLAFDDHSLTVVNQLASSFALWPFQILPSPAYSKTKQTEYEQLAAKITFFINLKRTRVKEYGSHGRNFFTNYYRNLLQLPKASLGSSLFGQFRDLPAIICGAGPSLAKNIDQLATLTDRALLLASGTAMNALNARGIMPHFGVAIDPNTAQYTRLVMNDAFITPYFYRNRLFYEALKLLHGKHLYINGTGGYQISDWFEEQLGIKSEELPEEGCSVMNFALWIAHALGCNPIIFVGVDLAYTDEKSYASNIPNHPIHLRKKYFVTKGTDEDVIVRPDIFGKPCFTLWKWLSESFFVTNFSRRFPGTSLINATEGGIGFFNVDNMPLEQVIKEKLGRQYDLDGWVLDTLQRAKMPKDVTPHRVEECMQSFFESLKSCVEIYALLQKQYEEHVAELSEEAKKAIKKLEQEPANSYLLKTFSEIYFDLQTHDFEALRYDDTDPQKKISTLIAQRYAFLQMTAQKNHELVKMALDSAPKATIASEPKPVEVAKKELDYRDPELKIHQEFYPNGKLRLAQSTLHGALHGPSTYGYETGDVSSCHWFLHGKREGLAHSYNAAGGLIALERYHEGHREGLQEAFYDDGTKKASIPYKEGSLDGEVTLYYPDGTLKRKIHFVAGKRHGKEEIFDEEGQLMIEAEFVDELPVGTARQWHANGQLALEIEYEKDSTPTAIREYDHEGKPVISEQRGLHDFFDQAAVQIHLLTQMLAKMVQQINDLGAMVEKAASQENEAAVQMLKSDIESLKKYSKALLEKSTLAEEEMIWKGPVAKRLMEQKLQLVAAEIAKHLQAIQTAFSKTAEAFAQTLKSQLPNINQP